MTDSNYDRLQNLIPIRHKRMSASPFAFYRGTAGIMAQDLYYLPHAGINIQAIGDCHLMNFGGFATPERSMIFDANDFDETHIAPWSWDLKRLATSFVLAARDKGMSDDDAREIAFTLAQSYRKFMHEFAEISLLDLWYMKIDAVEIRNQAKSEKAKKLIDEALIKSQKGTHQKVFYKITQSVLGNFEITDQPPLIYHPMDVKKEITAINMFLDKYADTLQGDRRWLFEQYRVVDVALKVVGVGSVGTRCYVVLLMNQNNEPLFLQVKEARRSVLEPYTEKSRYAHYGQRVVEGQRLVQAASDIFLGWSTGPQGRHFYFRQLRDRKIAPEVDLFDKTLLNAYARLCGRMLARAHAKTGNAKLLSGYMGKSEVLDDAISHFGIAYADQTERDYEDFMKAIRSGKLKVDDDPAMEK
ncbi:DUF2252 domain-containing protein [Taibaiella soli]|uniref:DUF2252 domain-containing protein n=1 Tax=Taibaiella soli TaxID=1649169 RepID=A0A2W2B189_9BACT|nr:DUF2252 domain-containing protein [Taibaiella soli]